MKYYAIWLSVICILMFILQLVVPGFTDSLVLNQNSFPEIWRFVTAIFLHGSLTHLILNLFALLLFGLILEKVIKEKNFLIIFFLSGIIANLIAVNFYSSSLGASGAVYGILGCLAVLRPRMTVWVYNLPMPMFIAALLWISISVFGIFFPSSTGDIAHLSGIAVGIIYGLFIRARFKEQKQNKLEISDDLINNWENTYMRR